MNLIVALLILSQAPLAASEDNPELREKYLSLMKEPRAPRAPVVEKTIRPDSRETSVYYLHAIIDRSVMITYDVGPKEIAFLQGAGAVLVAHAEEISHHTIFNGRYYRRIYLEPSAPEDDLLQKFVGQPMKFDVAMRSDGRQVVLDVRRP